jgi:hypothetical protein
MANMHNNTKPGLSAQDRLAIVLHRHKDRRGFPTIRVSVAQQNSVRYPYWAAVRYRVTLTVDGEPQHKAMERAARTRRSVAGAARDAEATGRYIMQRGPGRLTELEAAELLDSEEFQAWAFGETS